MCQTLIIKSLRLCLSVSVAVTMVLMPEPGLAEKNLSAPQNIPPDIRKNLPLVEFVSYLGVGVRVNERPKIYCRYRNRQVQLVVGATSFRYEPYRVYQIRGYYDARKKVVYASYIVPRKGPKNEQD